MPGRLRAAGVARESPIVAGDVTVDAADAFLTELDVETRALVKPAPLPQAAATTALVLPGLAGSGPAHWQTHWEHSRSDCRRVQQRDWHDPDPDEWSGALYRAIREHAPDAAAGSGPESGLVLVAHSLGCLLASAAAADFGDWGGRVRGALLVAPCDPERPGADPRVARFPTPSRPLPFATTVVASRDDPTCAPDRARCFAARWGASFIDVGNAGHLNADSDLDDWPFGQALLDQLTGRTPGRAAAWRAAAALRSRTLSGDPDFGCRGP